MIVALSLNPAVDVALTTDRIVYDDRTYVEDESESPGGKAINAARVLNSYGMETQAIAPYGGRNGERFSSLIRAAGIPITLVPVEGQTRRNIAISDRQGLTIKLDQRGAPMSAEELKRVEDALDPFMREASWLVLSGRLLPGVPDDFYASLIEKASGMGVATLLDTSGAPLELALKAGPSIVKPNRVEAERLLGRSLLTEAQGAEAARAIQGMGAQRVVLSMGVQGAIAAWENGVLRAKTPPARGGSPIGAGDVLAATCLWALLEEKPFPDALRWAVAAGSVSAGLPALGYGSLRDVERYLPQVAAYELQSVAA